jgi:hypothetical protein
VLRAGEYPLWFQLSEAGPALLDSIEDARLSAPLVPWPLAAHIPYMLARGDELLMAVNRDGFLRLGPWGVEGETGLFRVSGGEFWRRYTVGAFVLFEGKPAALLYRDDRFLDSGAELPNPRAWTFSTEAAGPLELDIPALDQFPPDEGWDADTVRPGPGGFWYYRLRKGGPRPEMRLLRTVSLLLPGEEASLGEFQNSALPEPLEAAPAPLGELLAAVLAGAGTVSVVSPEFPARRLFGAGSGPGFLAYYRNGADGPLAVAILPDGRGMYLTLNADRVTEQEPFTLPALPGGFVYTGIGLAAGVLCAVWEEQEEFNTGAAGFMVLQARHYGQR